MKRLVVFVFAAVMMFSGADIYAASVEAGNSVAVEAVKKPKKKDFRKVVFAVNLHCEKCVEKVRENISFERGVRNLTVSLDKHTIEIEYNAAKTSEEKLTKALKELGYEVKVLAPKKK